MSSGANPGNDVFISVVIPAHNSAATLPRCLDALATSRFEDYECIVVDDRSTDDTPAIAETRGARVIRLDRRGGPAAARNRGADEARGEILFFVDADVEVKADTLERVVMLFDDRETGAVIGSYDDAPPETAFVSRFKNLFHHYIHQSAERDAQTFWAGCGAVRRDAFFAVGGFNEGYHRPSIEDIELGYRLRDNGHSIVLDGSIQVVHLKRWTLRNMIITDIGQRGVPWIRLMLRRRQMPTDLNTRRHHQVSTLLVCAATGLGLAILVAAAVGYRGLLAEGMAIVVALLAITVALNVRLYAFFLRKAGPRFALLAIPLHLTYYMYCGVCLGWAVLTPNAVPDGAGRVDGMPSRRSRSGPPPGATPGDGASKSGPLHQTAPDRS